ncbi:MAG: methyl-accepting chemotaxis protein, partial [Firmicutes bacterium]|nr:methyl-accepting chemotaxis protein [Bacillota bacterium]
MSFKKWFRDMRLQSKIILLVAILIIFTGIIGVVSLINTNSMAGNINLLGTTCISQIEIAGRLREGLANIRLAGLRHTYAIIEDEFIQHEVVIDEGIRTTQEAFETLKTFLTTEEDLEEYDLIMAKWDQFTEMTETIVSLSRTGASPGTLDRTREQRGVVADELAEALNKITKQIEEDTSETVAASMATAVTGRIMIISLLVALIVIGLFLGLYIARNIANPLKELLRIVNKTASGDFTEDVESQSDDEIGNLVNAFGNMVKDLRGIIGQTAASAETIASTSEELAAAAEESASAVHQISSTVGEISAGIEEQTASTNQTAASVHQSNQAIAQVAEGAEAQVRHV